VQPQPVASLVPQTPFAPFVAVTATTEIIRGKSRVRVNQAYTDAILRAGLIPVVAPPLPASRTADLLAGVAGLVLTGGEDVEPRRYGANPHPSVDVHTSRDESELALFDLVRQRAIPTLAICRGIQLANVAMGGTLVQDISSERPNAIVHDSPSERFERVHGVRVEAGSRLAGALGAEQVATNSFHHQAIDRIGAGLRVTATTSDGVVEGVEAEDDAWWMLGVQWHPEELLDTPEDWDRRLFAAFAAAVHERAAHPV
jgi:putative glutamine amidotransferase